MASLRQRLSLTLLLVLALAVGPGAAAACPHLGDGEDTAPMAMHYGEDADSEMPPCHGAPVTPEPEPDDEAADCLAPCCSIAQEAPATPVAPAATALSAPSVEEHPLRLVRDEDATAVHEELDTGPPGPPARLHLLLGRFLT